MDLQKLVDTMNAAASQERANYHMTLGGLIEALSKEDPSAWVIYDTVDEASPSAPESYRGYYCDLSFPPSSTPITVGLLLNEAEEAIGKEFTGYKGGEFEMHADTPLWASAYGSASGLAIMGLKAVGNSVVLLTKQID